MNIIRTLRRSHAQPPARRGFAAGCLIFLGVVLLLLVIAVVVVALNWKSWAAAGIEAAATSAIDKSELPMEQKTRIKTRISSLATDFSNGKISSAQVGAVMQKIAEGPLVNLAAVWAVYEQQLKKTSWPTEEKDAAKLALQRLAHGLVDGSISSATLKSVVVTVMDLQPGGGAQLKHNPTDQDLRDFVAAAKKAADDAKVADEPYEVNVAAEFDKAIDGALGTSK